MEQILTEIIEVSKVSKLYPSWFFSFMNEASKHSMGFQNLPPKKNNPLIFLLLMETEWFKFLINTLKSTEHPQTLTF